MDSARVILRKLCDDPESRKLGLSILRLEHFLEKKHKYLFKVIKRLDKSQIITSEMLLDYVEKKGLNEKQYLLLSEEIGSIRGSRALLASEFEYALGSLAHEAQTFFIGGGIEKAVESLSKGNVEETKRLLRSVCEDSEGLEVKSSRRISARTMSDLKPDTDQERYHTGFQRFDQITGGGRKGELWLWAAFTGELKSTALISIAHSIFLSGKKVLFVSLEMDQDEIRRRLICQHAFYMGKVLQYRQVELGELNGSAATYKQVVRDFDKNSKYGDIQIWQPPIGITIDDVAREIEKAGKDTDIEVCILDYVQLLQPLRQRNQTREEFNETLQRAKKLAMEARGRKGVWLISGYQTSKAGWEKAQKTGNYDLSALSETVGAGQIANVIVWSLYSEEFQKKKEVKVGLMKSRNSSRVGSTHYLVVDPAVGCLSREPVNRVFDEDDSNQSFDLGELGDSE